MSDDKAVPEKTGKKRTPTPPVEHQFKAGNPGRPKGSRNKLGEAFLADLYENWQKNGAETIEAVRTEKPDAYLKVVASILPQQLNVKVSEFDELTDDQLDQRIGAIARALQLEVGAIAASGREAAAQKGKPLN